MPEWHRSARARVGVWIRRLGASRPRKPLAEPELGLQWSEFQLEHRHRHRRSGVSVPESEQRTDEFLVVAPATDRAGVDPLPYLPDARGVDRPHGRVEIQAVRIPGQADKIQDPASPLLLVL